MAVGDVVLSDSLLKLYLNFKKGGTLSGKDKKRLEQLFAFYKPHLTNKAQYDRINECADQALIAQSASAGIEGLSVTQLVKKSNLKVILTDDKNQYAYPYVNIDGNDPIGMNFTGTFKQRPRSKCIEHLKALCEDAVKVVVYDKYLCDPQKVRLGSIAQLLSLFCKCKTIQVEVLIPMGPLYASQHAAATAWWQNNSSSFSHVKASFPQIGKTNSFHDRYMRIIYSRRSVEILLSSGFDYLFQNAKDFTYIVTPV